MQLWDCSLNSITEYNFPKSIIWLLSYDSRSSLNVKYWAIRITIRNMWNKLHFLLSTPGVASITQHRPMDAPRCAPMEWKLGLRGEMSPEARPRLPEAWLTYTPRRVSSQESHRFKRCFLCLFVILNIMMQGKDGSDVNLGYFFVTYNVSQARACSLLPKVSPIFWPSAHCMCMSTPQIHSYSCLDWLVNMPEMKNPKSLWKHHSVK